MTNHTNYLTATMGRAPAHDEVAALIDHTLRVLEPCNEAWCESPEYRQLQLIHYGRRLQPRTAALDGLGPRNHPSRSDQSARSKR